MFSGFVLNSSRLSSKVVIEELVLSSLINPPLIYMKPFFFFTAGVWYELKCVRYIERFQSACNMFQCPRLFFFLIIPFQCSIRKKGFFAKDMAKTDE